MINLENLSDWQFILAALGRLNHHYDMGGVSCGRSLRSVCVERIIHWMVRHENVEIDDELCFKVGIPSFLDAAAQRANVAKEIQLVLFDFETLGIDAIPSEWLVTQFFRELCAWYERDRESELPLLWEDTLAHHLFRLWPFDYPDLKLPFDGLYFYARMRPDKEPATDWQGEYV